MSKKKEMVNGTLMKSDLGRLRDGLKAVLDAGYPCSDLGIQAARNYRRVSEEAEDLEKTREPKSEKFKEYAKAELALLKEYGSVIAGKDGLNRIQVSPEKKAEFVKVLVALKKKYSKALDEQKEKDKKFDEKAKATKADVTLKKVSQGLIKKEVPKFSSAHALDILEMIDE